MIRFIAILALGCLPFATLADPIPKSNRPLNDVPFRDGSKHEYRYRIIPDDHAEEAVIKMTIETKKAKVDEEGIYFERTQTFTTVNETQSVYQILVTNDRKVFLIENDRRIETPIFSNHRVGTKFKARSPDHDWDEETTVESHETIEVEGKTYKTVRSVQREIHDDDPGTTTFWRTNADGPGLVKVRFRKSGLTFEVTLEKYTPGKEVKR